MKREKLGGEEKEKSHRPPVQISAKPPVISVAASWNTDSAEHNASERLNRHGLRTQRPASLSGGHVATWQPHGLDNMAQA